MISVCDLIQLIDSVKPNVICTSIFYPFVNFINNGSLYIWGYLPGVTKIVPKIFESMEKSLGLRVLTPSLFLYFHGEWMVG